MVTACLYSGGKDSTMAIHKAEALGIKVGLLITTVSKNADSYMFHYPNVRYTELQAEAMGKEHVFFDTEGKKEEELEDLKEALSENDVDVLITGATYSRYQADRINRICTELGIEHLAPIWHIEPMEELKELSASYNAIITSVSAEGLETSLLGRRIDEEVINILKEANARYGINMLFEGGEAESFVLDAPLFSRSIEIKRARKEEDGMRGRYMIEEAALAEKKEY